MPDFSKAKAGDKVWSAAYGPGTIVNIDDDRSYPIKCGFEIGGKIAGRSYTFDGKASYNELPTLYWSEPEIIEPPAPKRKRKMEFTRYSVVFRSENGEIFAGTFASENKQTVMQAEGAFGIVELTGTFEWEE